MAVIDVALELIEDNPYNPRKHYPQAKVNEMAQSLREVGLRQVPEGRHVDGRAQLAYGHMRLRGFAANQKKDPEHWKMMPVDVKEISDQDMFHFAMEENLTRTDITPIEVARCIEGFSQMFPDVLDEELAQKHHMTAANVSNMKRVLRLPEKILEKIDNDVITFTQGRELLTLEGLENAENLMSSALGGLRTGNKAYGQSNTVEGLQASIHGIISSQYRPLDKEWGGYRWDLLFDTRAAGCLQCDKMLRTHPNKSQAAHYCTSEECWDRHDKEHREKAAAAAKAQMEADILRLTAEQGETATKVPGKLETYRIQNLISREWWDGEATSVEAACNAAGWKKENCWVRVKTERGGWSNVFGHMPTTPPPTDISQEMLEAESQAEEVEQEISQRIAAAPAPLPQEIPEDILAMAREKAGTRAEVLDLNDICSGDRYWRQMKQGYADLSADLRFIDDPQECLERCTRGFHYAFDSKAAEQKEIHVCSDTKCLAKKKAAFTRAKNAEGQARKNAERKALKEAIAQTTTLDRPRIKLILLAQMDGHHTSRHYYGPTDGKQPETWLWEKISAGTPAIERKREDLFKRIDKLSDEELARLVVEFMFYYLIDKGDIGSYEIKAEEPLKWMGITVEVEAKD